jgi:hypothetical protein
VRSSRQRVAVARELVRAKGEALLELADLLAEVQREGDLLGFCVETRIGIRRAYYLLQLRAAVADKLVTREDITAIGWTKTQAIVGAKLPRSQIAGVIRYAYGHSTRELREFLAKKVANRKFPITLYVTPDEGARVRRFFNELRNRRSEIGDSFK